MKIDGNITFSIYSTKKYEEEMGEKGRIRIELRDQDASIMFVSIELTTEQFVRALGGLGYCDISKMEVFNLDKVGKKMENKPFIFHMPINLWRRDEREEAAKERVIEKCPKGWYPDLYFRSQDSFFTKNNKDYARTTIRRWVEKKKKRRRIKIK